MNDALITYILVFVGMMILLTTVENALEPKNTAIINPCNK